MSDEIKNDEISNEDDYEPVIVSVEDEEGNEHTFEELDVIEDGDNEYVALIPIYDESEDLIEESGELIVLQRKYEGDEIYLEAIENEDEFMRIGKMFEERLSDMFEFEDDD
ncbi:MAG: DUF1292 domain-containing protein [Clostridiales bacterium]|nr:DUF1292 domain-containing protein [Clostridiales bacterium]